MTDPAFLAFDLGAGSGRAMLGTLAEGRLRLEEVHRFPNAMLYLSGHWRWNAYRLFEEMKEGLAAAAALAPGRIRSLAVDTWGVDFGLLAKDGSLLGLPCAYRDGRTEGVMERFFEKVPASRVYGLTGIQFLPFNTLYQLYALSLEKSPLLEAASDLLFMPDLFNYFFTGARANESTIASTSQLVDPRGGGWSGELLAALGIPSSLLGEIHRPGAVLAPLEETIAADTGAGRIPVVHAASHDTASAVAAVPAEGEAGWAYISSGTWSLMGIERGAPLLTEEARLLNFTNEGGVGGTFRLLKNITGLWLLQQCMKEWSREREYDLEELLRRAGAAEPFRSLVDPDHGDFLHPSSMTGAIREFCARTGQEEPQTPAQFARAILESLALKYRSVLEQLERLGGAPIKRIHVIGGGARNELLCRFTAAATGRPVLAGPVEATAAGNLLCQAKALGFLDSPADFRATVRRSFKPSRFDPEQTSAWKEAYGRFKNGIEVAS